MEEFDFAGKVNGLSVKMIGQRVKK